MQIVVAEKNTRSRKGEGKHVGVLRRRKTQEAKNSARRHDRGICQAVSDVVVLIPCLGDDQDQCISLSPFVDRERTYKEHILQTAVLWLGSVRAR